MPSDRDASISDAAFREALEEYRLTTRRSLDCPCEAHVALESEKLARVLALYAERQGEKAVVTDGTPDGQYIELRFVQSTRITDGDKVRVTKVEEGQ